MFFYWSYISGNVSFLVSESMCIIKKCQSENVKLKCRRCFILETGSMVYEWTDLLQFSEDKAFVTLRHLDLLNNTPDRGYQCAVFNSFSSQQDWVNSMKTGPILSLNYKINWFAWRIWSLYIRPLGFSTHDIIFMIV